MILKNRQLTNIYGWVSGVKKVTSRKFKIPLIENLDLIDGHLNKIRKLIEQTDEYKKLQILINKKHEAHCDKNADGSPKKEKILVDGIGMERFIVTIPENQKRIDDYVAELRRKNKKEFDHFDAQIKEYEEAMEEDCLLKFKMVKQSDVPEEVDVDHMLKFKWMIK